MAAIPRPTPHLEQPKEQHLEQSPEQRRAADIIRLLSLYRPLLDAFIIDFFTEDLWAQLPPAWQPALASATPLQLARLLGGRGGPGAAWPLSLLAFAAAARALAFPRGCREGPPQPPCQSSHLHPLLRRHVKPKKQHEIRRLGKVGATPSPHCNLPTPPRPPNCPLSPQLLQRLSQATCCEHVVDIGAGQGHLSRFLAFGLGLSVTAAPRHVAGRLDPTAPWGEFLLPPEPPGPGPAARNPLGGPGGSEDGGQVLVTGLHACGDLSPALLRHFTRSAAVAAVVSVGCCYMKLSTTPQPPSCPPGYPLSATVAALLGHQLSYRAREAACHALEEYEGQLRRDSSHLRTHCYRAVLESLICAADPSKRHLGVQPGRKAHTLGFPQYAHLGLPLAGLDPAEVPLDSGAVGAMLEQQHKVVAFCTLGQLLAPAVETLILLDRLLYLREQGFHCALVPLFNPRFSPRNLVLVATRTPLAMVLAGLDKDSEDENSSKDMDSSEDEDPGEAEPPRKGQS
ncbi:RRNAD protein, partial [Origma solitaria]|nr:RRNAD protein [Origma solitaria]